MALCVAATWNSSGHAIDANDILNNQTSSIPSNGGRLFESEPSMHM